MQKAPPTKDSQADLPRVIAISSGKGGVGKSSIAVNLGISLAKTGARVCLLDADTGLANANILLGITPEFSIEHVLYGAKDIDEIMLDGPHGLKIIPGANGISECVSLHPRQQLRLTRELARVEGDFDFLLIDTAAGIADTTLDFIGAAHHTLIVITPEPTSLTDAFSLIKLLKRRRHSAHYQVVVNMCSSASQAKEVFHRFAAAVEKYISAQCHYLGFILRDESMRAAVVLQNPVAMFPDDDPSSRSFMKLSESLAAVTKTVPASGSFSAFWHRQYREYRKDDDKQAGTVAQQALTEAATAESRDSDYLSELRSRVLLLIEQGHADEASVASLLQESLEAFIKRHDKSPVDLLKTVEQLVSSPDRDDQLVRDIAERVKPWAGLTNTPPLDELSISDLPAFDEDPVEPAPSQSLPLQPEPAAVKPTFEIISEVKDAATAASEMSERSANTSSDQTDMPTPSLSASVPRESYNHGYDQQRFGSQESLLKVLQNNSNASIADLLESFK
ncbi:MinD/ParA family protein [Oceanicoccus sagamiensis]|uniref:Cobyrinic acid ac-diamide synthase n=1 Tax=Oceanicoccus sagamiensis TaxID=716816 RepID=A0A1X9N4H3_9GAMM|nr:MinD/ParA family protein [Oceanicoccus sagamiensis]ARN73040.1 cobyrinic acid ac-diamide synthase [Oceanicoccus sagamiensis]